jgi:UDPglucose 6-dehydrogenase
MNITVAGLGYVGLSNAVLLSQTHSVIAYDIDPFKIECIEKKVSPFNDSLITEYLKDRELNIIATTDFEEAIDQADIFIIATPTDFIEITNSYDTSSIESIIKKIISTNKRPLIVIKSTVPIAFTEGLRKKFKYERLVFSPEFLREGRALEDCLYPSRIIFSNEDPLSQDIANIYKDLSLNNTVNIISPNSTEAEAIKLFSNSYLAMRVAFFNELDTFCESMQIDSRSVINGLGFDPRIGNFYNNPSFGFGGYCLPKDSRQLVENFSGIPNRIIKSIVESNEARMDYIASKITNSGKKVIGIHRLAMKKGSDNFRSSSIIGIIDRLRKTGMEILIYEPILKSSTFLGLNVEKNISSFKEKSEIIVSNRMSTDLLDVRTKVYTRDIFGLD